VRFGCCPRGWPARISIRLSLHEPTRQKVVYHLAL
jgi:hypothetical protein